MDKKKLDKYINLQGKQARRKNMYPQQIYNIILVSNVGDEVHVSLQRTVDNLIVESINCEIEMFNSSYEVV